MADQIAQMAHDILDLADALESMVEQYLYTDREGEYDHMFMSAGEEACDVLCELYPDRWIKMPWGMKRKGRVDG